MAKNPTLNRIHQRAWYVRTRQDPVQWRAFLAKRRAYKQARRNSEQTRSMPIVEPRDERTADIVEEPHPQTVAWALFYEALVAGVQPEVPAAP